MRMRTQITLLVLWFIFTGIFLYLGITHLGEADHKIEIGEYKLPEVRFGKVAGVPTGKSNIEEYAIELQRALKKYIEEYNSASQKQNIYTAYGYFVACATSIVSFFATLFSLKSG